jgi:hypothetical protein
VLVAWADDAAMRHDLPDAIEALRAVLAKPRGVLAPPRRPRQGTKREQVLGLLRRPEGATVGQVVEATGWAPHTVRGFLAGLARKGVEVSVLERVRQVGPTRRAPRELQRLPHRGGRLMRPGGPSPCGRALPRVHRRAGAERARAGGAAAAVRAFAAAQGWTLVAEFSDVASGKDDRRPGFRAALARCRQLGAVLAAARLDRITRARTRCRSCWRTATRCAPPTCRAPTT